MSGPEKVITEQKDKPKEEPKQVKDAGGNLIEKPLVDEIEMSLGNNLGRNTLIVRGA